jgi:DeoR/GlpR family transcriptional regulator of sugar metabolism
VLPTERKRRIVALLRERREVSVQELADILAVPAASVRRDLRELEGEHRISRRHGHAVYRPAFVPAPVEHDADIDPALVDELVAETVYILSEARNLFLTGGPVLVRAAGKLSGKTIATHDLALAMAAATGDNDVSLLGREVDNRTMTLRAEHFAAEVGEFWFDAAVVEVDGVDEKNLWVARQNHGLLGALMQRSDSLVAVAKSSVLGRKGDRVAGPLTRADVLILDKGASDEERRALIDAGLEVRVAGGGDANQFGLDKVGNVYVFKKLGGRFPGRERGREG